MARPIKSRRVNFIPGVDYYKPASIPMRDLEEVCLSYEEIESIRLKDLEGLEQEKGAMMMNVSRPTYQRILSSARQKIADAILNGKAIRIEGGNYELIAITRQCINGHEWIDERISAEALKLNCPVCNEPSIRQVPQISPPAAGGRRLGRRRRGTLSP